jgi:putative nucleotidyltransferase-like protein
MWAAVDQLVARAPGLDALRFHRLHLLAARAAIAAGEPLAPELARDRDLARADVLAAPLVLGAARAAWDGPLVLVKGPEVACDYPASATRPFGDLDLLCDDAPAAQRALLAAGFREIGDPALYENIHHLRPLWWPGTALSIELHTAPKWPAGLAAPPIALLVERAEPSRTGVAGIGALPAAEHCLILAAHAWAHEPLARAGHLIDVAATLARAERAEVDRLAADWGCTRMWRTVARAAGRLVGGERSAASACWARHLAGARERTVFEAHLQDWLAPLWGLPPARAVAASARAVGSDLRRDGLEPWRTKAGRMRAALRHATRPKSEHDRSLERPLEDVR